MEKEKFNFVDASSLSENRKNEKQEIPEYPKRQKFYFDGLVKIFDEIIDTFPDYRFGKNVRLNLRDAVLGAFSVFFTQSPSFLSYQKSMQMAQGRSNAASLFGIKKIISDSHIRRLLDPVPCFFIYPIFWDIFNRLLNEGYLSQFRSYNGNFLVALDATGYFSSESISCDNCSQKVQKNGIINYSHSAITPVLVSPGIKKAVSLVPEIIKPQDGHEKQDCENAAAKRWLSANGKTFKRLGTTVLGDDLYCRQPFCELVLTEGLNFILNCKESSHVTLYEYIGLLEENVTIVTQWRFEGKKQFKDTYRFLNGVPLKDGKNALEVNWCELITTREDKKSGEIVYKNTFATNFEITQKNVSQIVAEGRTRWKIENENNNTLKTKGYNLEHNFGHGKKNLSSVLLTLNVLAFLFHTVLDLTDEKYQLIRQAIGKRKNLFDHIRVLTQYMYFEDWEHLEDVMLKRREFNSRLPDGS